MKSIPYASAVRSLMYAQVCSQFDIAFITGLLGRFQTKPGLNHWEAIKKTLCYLQGTKHLMLTYRNSDELKFVGYADADFAGVVIQGSPRQVTFSSSLRELYHGKAPNKL
jgi:hypothetical protein